jgi:DNA-binding Xre family transcriptional regulator
METTFDRIINNNPKRKEKFDKEYKAGVSPTVIQKIRSKNAERINFRTFTNVLNSLGYRISIEKFSCKMRKRHITRTVTVRRP